MYPLRLLMCILKGLKPIGTKTYAKDKKYKLKLLILNS